ncbi:hypothetical protein D3H65_12580 [Paraflavitalea soli]|uniref:Uncharacterized protein n=1 Tax=Paraflavitalea soli TaxID=2315862 RepID=A0A3B7MKR7_9BACT|nr:hypothetical protein [Paraflavitalea soli]AXY74768.1 hypothetical protein D3H65_12580 [Paraflavitalea soli]
MKKRMLVAAATIVLFFYPDNTSSARYSQSNGQLTNLFVYSWYYDQGGTDPTGTLATISDEVESLREIYSGYVFTSTPTMGLREFEFGYFSYYPAAVIYTNMPW